MKRTSLSLVLLGVLSLTALPLTVAAQHGDTGFHDPHSGPKVDYEARYDAAVPLADSEAGQQVMAGLMDAYGGIAEMQELQGFRLHYSLTPMMSDEAIPVVKSFQRDRRYHVVHGDEQRVLNQDRCWYAKGEQVAEMDGGRYRAELFSYLTLAMPLAAETERFDGVRFGEVDDDPLSYLYFDKADSVLVVLGIDPETHLIRKSTGVIRQDENRFVFINEFDDFRQVEGFWFPHSLVNISMGLRVGESVLDRVEVNPDFDAGEFGKPQPVPDPGRKI